MKNDDKIGSTNNLWLQLFICLIFACCWQPSFATSTTPTSDFMDNGDGTVTHKTTGLMWMRCAMGQTWNQATSSCSGTATTYEYSNRALPSDFAGKTDWRVPNIAELQSIIEYENFKPAINTTIFPNTPFSEWFWSGSSSSYTSDYGDWRPILGVSFSNGSETGSNQGDIGFVRLVRGKWYGLNTFFDNLNGTVIDQSTGLTWQRCSVGQKWTGTTCIGQAKTFTFTQAIALKSYFASKNDWRVPQQNELLSILGFYGVNDTLFPNTPNRPFWSTSSVSSDSNEAWGVIFDFYFTSGGGTYFSKNAQMAVRFVRGEKHGTADFFKAYDIATQAAISVDFGTNYDARGSQIIELQNTTANPITIANVIVSDAKNYWLNLYLDKQFICRANHATAEIKNFTIPANGSCRIGVGFSPFDNLTVGKSLVAQITLKTLIKGIASDKVINLSGIGRAQVVTLSSDKGQSGVWGVTQIKAGNPPLKSDGEPKTWYSQLINPKMRSTLASVGNVAIFAGNNQNPAGYVGIVIQEKPVIILSSTNMKDQNGDITHQWKVKPLNWYPIKPMGNNVITWQPFITSIGTTTNQHYRFIDWNSTLY